MMKQVFLLFCFAFALTISDSDSKTGLLQPHAADESFSEGYIQMKTTENCSYLVIISTSCSSPAFTSDTVSLAFGDAYGHKVYVPKLGDPISRTFERCSRDTFQVDGACASPICYAYLYRSGSMFEGWEPESVKIYGYDAQPVTFVFNTSIPNGTWYGHNLCQYPSPPPPSPPPPSPSPPPPPHPPSPPSSSFQLSPLKWLIFMVLGLVLTLCM
ncbi:hypothetical protein RJT34_26228 [Clitoria ternatea]|uniref:Uncharacterized protein n=1 Tax=Clitoria ternatea TaxID=43366 RepID=A0AAN9F8L7_CLITE